MDPRRSLRDAASSSAARLHRWTNRLREHAVVHKLSSLLDGARATARSVADERLPEVAALGRRLAERILIEPTSGRRPVVNASDVVLPDGIDLALPVAAMERMAQQACAMMASPSGSGLALAGAGTETGHGLSDIRRYVRQWTGADSALVLHNEAAALTAVFAGLASGGEIVTARGHIGRVRCHGLVSLTDVVAASGARLREVGSIDRVTVDEYSRAAGNPAALVLHAAPVQYAIAGDATAATLDEIVEASHRAGLPVVDFLPAAQLVEMPGLSWLGPTVGQSLLAGADMVVFSGQRYLGGPPCGIVAGRRDLIDRIADHPLSRILAADRFTLSALEATLELAGDPLTAERAIPLWQLLAASSEALRNRAQRLAPQLGNCTRVARAEVVDGVAHLGPGRLPAQQLRDWCVAVEPTSGPPEQLAEALRAGSPSIWTAMEHGRLVIHLRGVLARDDEQIAAAFNRLGTRTPIVEQRIANPAANGLSATSGATAAQSPRPCHISPNISTREDLPPAE